MSSRYIHGHFNASKPQRPLRSDFTQQVIRNAVTAKKRRAVQVQFQQLFKEPFSMKTFAFLRTVPGLVLMATVVATSSVGVYALSNWFGGAVSVSQNKSVLTVDLSSCQGNLPPGVNPNDDRHQIQFKILGNPHVSAADLQQSLLGECEYNAITAFYGQKFPDMGGMEGFKYMLLPARIVTISPTNVTLSSTGEKVASFGTHTFALASDLSVYSEGRTISTGELKPGDTVAFVAYSSGTNAPLLEGTTILDSNDVQVVSLFKTQFDDGVDRSFDYQAHNIMPLDIYKP